MSSDPLSRFRVIDLRRARAGPTCVKQFADFGAAVIKVEAINRVGVPCGPSYKVDELFGDPDIHLPLHASVQHRRLGQVKLVNQMVELSRTPAQLRSAIPELGEHTDAILADLGYDARAIAGLRARRVV